MSSKKNKSFFSILVLVCIIFSLALTFYSISRVELYVQEKTVSSRVVEGEVKICVDAKPPVIYSLPPSEATVDELFQIQVNATSLSNRSIYYYDNTSLFVINRITGKISFIPNSIDVGLHIIEIKATHEICPGIYNSTDFILGIFPAEEDDDDDGNGGGGGYRLPKKKDITPPLINILLSQNEILKGKTVYIFCSVKDLQSPIARNVSLFAPEPLIRFSCQYNDTAYSADCMASYASNTTGKHTITCTAKDLAGNSASSSVDLIIIEKIAPFVPFSMCGDKICQEDETQASCCTDCGCPKLPGCHVSRCINNKCQEVCCFIGYCCIWWRLCWYWWILIFIIILIILIYMLIRKKFKKAEEKQKKQKGKNQKKQRQKHVKQKQKSKKIKKKRKKKTKGKGKK